MTPHCERKIFYCSDSKWLIHSRNSLLLKKHYQPTSWLPILTTTVYGKGDMPAASVMGGTTPLPRSDEVYVIKVWTVLIKVAVSVLLKVRSKRCNEIKLLVPRLLKTKSVPIVLLGCLSSALITLGRKLNQIQVGSIW